MEQNNRPSLHGIKVVELGTSVAAPYAGWILASLGAQVMKVERPDGGDDARRWGQMFADGSSPYFQAFNRDKHSVTVDLNDETEREWLVRYCTQHADVVIQNMRPGRVASKGLSAQALRGANPRLIYCNMGAFGARGPLKEEPGYDPLMQAYSGIMSATGEPGRPPVRVATSLVDMGTGMWTVIGILSALRQRDESGIGCEIDTSLYETALGWMSHLCAAAQASGRDLEPSGSGARGIVPYQAYACSDGYLVVAAANDRLFARLSEALAHPQWCHDARFVSNPTRVQHRDALNALLEPIFIAKPRAHWQQLLKQAGVPNAPVRTTFEMMADAQTAALGMLRCIGEHPLQVMELPLSVNGVRARTQHLAPELGAHNEQYKETP